MSKSAAVSRGPPGVGLKKPTAAPTARIKSEDTIINTGGLSVALVLAESALFLYGFNKQDQVERPPAILRGSLVVRVLKPTKIKSILLEFKGTSRTEWPEGIPPKKVDTFEVKELMRHGWTFFNAAFPGSDQSSGAHLVHTLDGGQATGPLAPPLASQTPANPLTSTATGGSSTGFVPTVSSGLAAPPEGRGRTRSNTLESKNVKDIFLTVKQAPLRQRTSSPSPNVGTQHDTAKGFRLFQPAEYVYNFELAVPQIMAETMRANFGHTRYVMEAHIDRFGTFKTNLSGSKEVTLLRSLAMSNLDSSEPIVISRDWENLLHYEVIIAGKAFAIGGVIPIAFSLVPLEKVKCHRIRVYLTEHTEYYCRNRKVHRVEPTHKFLLLEKIPDDGIQGSLINATDPDVSSRTELEFNVKVPTSFKDRHDKLRPNFSSQNIKVHHWIKVVMRLSRKHPTDPKKLKSYEVSIDSPVTLVDKRTVSASQLPEYNRATPPTRSTSESFAFQAHQGFVDSSSFSSAGSSSERAIHFLRQPSIAPPAFDADNKPPNAFPPKYEETQESLQSYRRRFEEYERTHTASADSDNNSNLSANTSESSSSASTNATTSSEPERQRDGETTPHFTEIIWKEDSDHENDNDHDRDSGLTLNVQGTSTPTRGQSQELNSTDVLASLNDSHIPEAPEVFHSVASSPLELSPTALIPVGTSTVDTADIPPIDTPRTLAIDGRNAPNSSPALDAELPRISRNSSASSIPRFAQRTATAGSSVFREPGFRRPGGEASWLAGPPPRNRTPSVSHTRSDSVSSSRGRYFRQASVVSMDPTPAPEDDGDYRLQRYASRVSISEASEVTENEWRGRRRGSESSLAISISEYVGPERQPLLSDSSNIRFEMDYEDDAQSVRSGFYNILTL